MTKINQLIKKPIIFFIIFTLIVWSLGYSFLYLPSIILPAQADGGVSPSYLSESQGMDIMIATTSTMYAIGQFDIFDSNSGNLSQLRVTLMDVPDNTGFNPSTDLLPLSSTASSSGMSLWRDNGDGQFNASSDTPAPTLSSWGNSGGDWYAVFNNINSNSGFAFSASTNMKVFIVFQAAQVASSSAKGFEVVIENSDMIFGGGSSIGTWPSYNHFFPPVWIGEAGAGGYGAPLLISEIKTAGGNNTDEFIEIYNRAPSSISLAGWSVRWSTSTESSPLPWTTTIHSFSSSSVEEVVSGGYYLFGHGYVGTTTDVTYPSAVLNESGGYVGIFNPMDEVMDWVGYGTLSDYTLAEGGQAASAPAASSSIERKAFYDSTAGMMIDGGIDQYMGNGEDSHNNAMDFIVRSTSGPQNSTSPVEIPQGGATGGSSVVINEVYYKANASERWIELFNRSDSNQNISNYVLKHKNYSYTFPGAMSDISTGDYLVVKWNQGSTNNQYTTDGVDYIETGNVSMSLDTYGGDIVLYNNSTEIQDYVEYGGSGYTNEAMAVSSMQWMAGDYVPHCLWGESIGRDTIDGDDWNDSSDWQTYGSPSAGAPNMGGDSTAPTAVTLVTLSDNDNTANSGLDGQDITIIWKPASTTDSTFNRYEIYLLASTTQIDWNTHQPIESLYSGQYQYDGNNNQLYSYTYTGGNWIDKDSANALLANGEYVAYVLAFDDAGNKSGTAQSSISTLSGETYDANADVNPPHIMHMGVWNAATGSDIQLIARFDDDRELHATTPAQVVWEAGTSSAYPNLTDGVDGTINCSYIDDNFYNCTIPWNGGWDTDTVIGYYLKAMDAASPTNEAFLSSSWEADMSYVEATVQANPIFIDIMTAPSDGDSDPDLSGYTYKWDGNILASTTIFLEGTAIGMVTSNASGTFAFADNTIDFGMYYLMAFKEGYMQMMNNVYQGDTTYLYLNEGDMNYGSGDYDSGGNPYVTWTAPYGGMMGAPIDIYCTSTCSSIATGEEPIIIAFDRPMNESTINDQDASDAASNIYLTTNGNDRVSGKVYYDSSMQQARFYSTTNNSLSTATYYNIVVTQGVTDEQGNPISGSNPDGSFSNGFTTIMSTTTDFADYGTTGEMMPPYVMGMTPSPGSFGVSRNTSINIEFSEPMDSSMIDAASLLLRPITDSTAWTKGAAVSATVSLDQATMRIVTISPDVDLNASYSWWVVEVRGDVKSSMGIWVMDPTPCSDITVCSELADDIFYEASFQINTGATDTTKPTVLGTFPKNNDGISDSMTAVNVGIGAIEIGFSESMDASTINTQNINLLAGSNAASGKVSYDPMSNNAKFMPFNSLLANTQYTLRVGVGVHDLAGNALNATSTTYFKTGSADTSAPELMYANGDDYSIALTFNEPMNAASQTDTSNWTYSVLNPANYAVNGLLEAPLPWSSSPTILSPYDAVMGTPLSGQGLSFFYEEYNNTVIIEGFAFGASAESFQIFVDNTKDRSNNIIRDSGNRATSTTHYNAARAPLYNSTDTYGDLGPGTMDYTMDMGDMGMMMAGAFPMNSIAGQSSIYFVDIPTTKIIPIGGKIVLSFPAGFDVSSAIKDPYSPINDDINEWNTGKVEIYSVTGDQSARTVTIIATTSATQLTDYLHMDIKGIVNSSIPKDFGTEGYFVDIKIFTADGVLLESVSTMPFFISEGGVNTISGDIHGVSNGDIGTTTIFLGSPMTGPMETQVAISGDGGGGADGTYSFTNLPDGEYFIFTEPSITLGSNTYFGNNFPEPIWLSGASTTRDITLTPETSGGAAIKVILTGDFSTDSVADNVDIFAGSPNGFRVKTLTSVGNTAGTASTTMYLSAGDWMIGVGPAMPMGPMDGPPPMPDWMPPVPVYYSSDGTTADTVNISIAGQTIYTVSGTVEDGSGNGIADAEVYAYQPMGGYGGAYTKTAADGAFTLKIPVLGTYNIGAFKPGLPEPMEKNLNVTANVSGLTIKISKPDYTISGKVINSTGNAVAYAPVWAWQQDSWGHADTMSDSAGNYILYVNDGTWYVETDIPGAGWTQYELPITINGSSAADINLSPSIDTDFYTISGIVGVDTNGSGLSAPETLLTSLPIRAVKFDANGVYQGQEFNSTTDSNGEYSMTVPAGIYRVDIWTPGYGEIGVNNQNSNDTLNEAGIDDDYANNPANIDATSGNVSNADIIIVQGNLNTITLFFANSQSGQEGFLNIEGVDFSGSDPKPNGFHMFQRIDDLSATNTIELADGDYFFFIEVPGPGSFIPDDSSNSDGRDVVKDDIVVSGDRNVDFTLTNLSNDAVTISGTVKNASSQAIDGAWVWVGNPSNGYHNGTQSAADGTYSLVIPTGSGYKMGADKPGYMSGEPIDLNASANATKNFTLSTYTYTLSGYIYSDLAGGTSNQYDAGEGLPSGFVRAETTKCSDSAAAGSCVKAHAPVDGTGFYELGIVNGIWKVYGMANGYSETYYGSTITISGANAVNKHIELTVDSDWTSASKKKPITPASGGTLDDTSASGTKIKITIPPNALGNSSAAGNVNTQKTSAVTQTNSSVPVGDTGVSVTATDNSGQGINNLNDYIDIEMVLYKADIDAALASENLTYAKLKNTKNSYWDSTANDWVNLATTRKAYYSTTTGSTNWVLYASSSPTVSAFEAFIDEVASSTITLVDYKLVFISKTNHLTIFAVIMPFIAIPAQADPGGDDPPPSSGGGGTYISNCTSVTYGEWSECIDNSQAREVSAKSPSGCRLTSSQEADKTRECVVGEEEESDEEEIITPISETISLTTIDALYLDQGSFLERADIDEILPALGNIERNHLGERLSRGTLIDTLGIDLNAYEPRVQYALTNYITYGSPDTVKLGWGERAGVLNSFMAAFSKAPTLAEDWSDIIKIANGRWPTQRSEMAENRSTEHFKKIYLRDPNRENPNDDAAITVVAYGLRPANRNMESEAAAIRIFKAIYGYAPTGAVDWDVVRAIAYSGATR